MGLVLIMLVLDLFLYAGLAWYLERVIPGQFGPCLPWWFPASKSFWLTGNLSTDDLARPAPGAGLWEWGTRQTEKLRGYLGRTLLQKYIAVGQDEPDVGQNQAGTQQPIAQGPAALANGRAGDVGTHEARGPDSVGRLGGSNGDQAPAAEMLSLRKVGCLSNSSSRVRFVGLKHAYNVMHTTWELACRW